MSDLRKKFTENAEQFDSLMVEMLAENAELLTKLEEKEREVECKDMQIEAIKELYSVDDLCARQKISQEALASLHKEEEDV